MIHSDLYIKLVKDDMLCSFCNNAAKRSGIGIKLDAAFSWSDTPESGYWLSIGKRYGAHKFNDYDLSIIVTHHPEYFV